jgi:transposase-like protein
MLEREIKVDHTSIDRWVLKYTPEIEKKFRKHKHVVRTSWRMDETYMTKHILKQKEIRNIFIVPLIKTARL